MATSSQKPQPRQRQSEQWTSANLALQKESHFSYVVSLRAGACDEHATRDSRAMRQKSQRLQAHISQCASEYLLVHQLEHVSKLVSSRALEWQAMEIESSGIAKFRFEDCPTRAVTAEARV